MADMDISLLRRELLARDLRGIQGVLDRYGLALSEGEIAAIADARADAVGDTGRVELGRSIVRDIAYAFCDSPYIERDSWADTLCSLTASFFYFKNESDDLIPDEDLIAMMRTRFDGDCGGSAEAMEYMDISDLVRGTRYGHETDDPDLRLF